MDCSPNQLDSLDVLQVPYGTSATSPQRSCVHSDANVVGDSKLRREHGDRAGAFTRVQIQERTKNKSEDYLKEARTKEARANLEPGGI